MAGFDAGSPHGGSCSTECFQHHSPCYRLLAPAAILSAFLTGACLSDGWLMNRGYSYLWERRIAYFTHVTVLIGKVWQHLVWSMYSRYTKGLLKSLWFSLISPLQHLSPQDIKQLPLEFLSEVEREEGKTWASSLITVMKPSTKHKFISQALWHRKSRGLFNMKKEKQSCE